MTYEEVLERARAVLAPKCRVCKVCDGKACRGEVPGVGAIGSGAAFTSCRTYLDQIKIHMDAVHEHFEADTSFDFFGKKLSAPVMAAPIGGLSLNYTGVLSEGTYSDAVVKGCVEAGIMAFTGDGPMEEYFFETIPAIQSVDGAVVPTIKPWEREKMLGRFRALEPLGCPAAAMDIDSAALINLKKKGKPAFTKSIAELREVTQLLKVPFLVKGVMTPKSALACLEAGAKGIVISTHGGRILEDTMPPCFNDPRDQTCGGRSADDPRGRRDPKRRRRI